jgi:DNA-binding transcriptional LysR family regulator
MKTTLDEMQAFVAVVDNGSITATAQELGQTISAVSRTLTRLEQKLQTTLIRRTTRRLELTEEGKTYLDNCRQIIASVEETEELMSMQRNKPAGRLRVDAASSFMLHVVVPLIPAYQKRYPQVELELNSNEGIVDLLERRTDVAIRIGRLKDSSLHATLIGSSRIRVLASPDYLAKHGTPKSVSDLTQHTLLGFNQPELLNEWPLLDAEGQPFHIRPTIRSSSGETLRQLALQRAGIACLSDFMTRSDRKEKKLQLVMQRQTLNVRQAINAVYYRNTALSSRIASFVNYLTETIGKNGFDE